MRLFAPLLFSVLLLAQTSFAATTHNCQITMNGNTDPTVMIFPASSFYQFQVMGPFPQYATVSWSDDGSNETYIQLQLLDPANEVIGTSNAQYPSDAIPGTFGLGFTAHEQNGEAVVLQLSCSVSS